MSDQPPREPRSLHLLPSTSIRDDECEGWTTMPHDTVRHLPIGDAVELFTAAGVEFRIQTRRI